MKAPSESGITKILWLACAGLIAAMALNAPSPNGQGGWRDQFVEGWNEAQAEQDAPDHQPGSADVAATVGEGG